MTDAIAKILGERCPDHDPDCLLCQAWDEYDALRAEHDRLTGRGVKPLVWSEWGEKNGGVTRFFRGEGGGHVYKVTLHLDASGCVHHLSSLKGDRLVTDARIMGLDRLKSAAQADYERRILSALSPSPAVSVAEAARVLLNSGDPMLELEMMVHGDDDMVVSEALERLISEAQEGETDG